MRQAIAFTALICAFLFVTCPLWPQAVVNESLETKTLYVDVKQGSDSNSGTQPLPFKSIEHAASVAMSNKMSGVGTKVIINPGTYRESWTLNGNQNQPSVPVTFEAAAGGPVVVTGSVSYNGWIPYTGNSSIYTTSWRNRWGLCTADLGNAPLEQPIVLRREMIFVNGTALTQVLSLDHMVFPGTFFVDETNAAVYIWPPSGTDMNNAAVEVATNPTLLNISGGGPNLINGVVIRGITFEHANPCYNGSAVVVQEAATNILFDSDSFVWNNGQGIAIDNPAANITIKNSASNHNGAAGFQGYRANNVLYQNVEASYNNWRGAQGAYYFWSAGGAHIFSDHNETMNGFTAKFNQTYSIHWDTDVQNINVDGMYSSNNMVGPLFEKSEGPLSVSNSQLCYSQSEAAGYGGFVIRNSRSVSLTGNVFYDNKGSQLLITGVQGGISVNNWQTGDNYNLVTRDLTFERNVVVGLGTQQVFKNGYLGGSDWTQFVTSLNSDHNTWWQHLDDASFSVPAPRAGTKLNFNLWQAQTGQDFHSQWSKPASNAALACAQAADGPDFWLSVDNDVVNTDQSGQAVFHLATVGLGGLVGTVTLLAEGISGIPGATVYFSSSKVATTGASVLTVHTSAKTPAGLHTFTVLANVADVTRALTVTFKK